ncbi:MAG: hypothetical protein AAF561_05735 [Planctomycetota bacterium]
MPTDTSSPRPESPPRKRGGVDADALLRSLAPVVAKPEAPADSEHQPAKPTKRKAKPAATDSDDRRRAKLDVAINPGEGTTAIYVRVPRTTHVALKLLALQNQAAMEGPTELASIVRQAVDDYLQKQRQLKAAA